MLIVVPFVGFFFMLTFLGALADIRQGKDWLPLAFFAALLFALLLFCLVLFTS